MAVHPSTDGVTACDFTVGRWLNRPSQYSVSPDTVRMTTAPDTDLWQRSYYGFQRLNPHAVLLDSADNFTFTARADFRYSRQFDQCGVMAHVDDTCWFKASIEHEETAAPRLGSVVTNHGYSDWATTDIEPVQRIWYRLSRRGPDFLVEHSSDGSSFKQMRVFHLALLGDTVAALAASHPPTSPAHPVSFGLYACSPGDSSFTVSFSGMCLEPCVWRPHMQARRRID